MRYRFRCEKCRCEEEKEIAIKDYDTEKEKQTCTNCGEKMTRVIEWQGIADSSNNNGWFGRSDGCKAI